MSDPVPDPAPDAGQTTAATPTPSDSAALPETAPAAEGDSTEPSQATDSPDSGDSSATDSTGSPAGGSGSSVPDLAAVTARIDEAREAEEHLMRVMPSGIQPDDDAYEGMSGPTEGDVDQPEAGGEPDDRREARSDHQPLTQEMTDEVTDEDGGPGSDRT